MNEGDIVLAPLPQADGKTKPRPALVLRKMPPFGDFLVCGISSQIRQGVYGFDEWLETTDADFAESGLLATSVIRLGFLAILPKARIIGVIGHVSVGRRDRLLKRLSDYLVSACV